jgi:hypothetical protein
MYAPMQPLAAPVPVSIGESLWQPGHERDAADLALMSRALVKGLDAFFGSKPAPPAPMVACCRPRDGFSSPSVNRFTQARGAPV